MWRSQSLRYSGASWGTTVETIIASIAPKLEPVEREQVRERRRELVRGDLRIGGQAPVVRELGRRRRRRCGSGCCRCRPRAASRDYRRRADTIPRMADAKLFVIPGSHPSMSARLMLERKGITYKRIDLVPVVSKGVVRVNGFPGKTVPALKIGGRKVQGSREIARALDRDRPLSAALPLRCRPSARRSRRPRAGATRCFSRPPGGTLVGAERNRAPMASTPRARGSACRSTSRSRPAARSSHCPRASTARPTKRFAPTSRPCRVLDKIDAWIADGVLGGEQPNAADIQIATSLRLLMSFEDLRPAIESRPAGEMALRVAPDFPGRTPPVFPAEWLACAGPPSAAPGRRGPAARRRASPPAPCRAPRGRREAACRRAVRARGRARAGSSTKRRERASGWGSVSRSVRTRARPAAAGRGRSRGVRGAGRRARGPGRLDRLAGIEHRSGPARSDPHRRIQEVGLVEDLAHRLGLIHDETASTSTPWREEPRRRRGMVRLAVADVGAKAQVADPGAHWAGAWGRLQPHSPSSSGPGRAGALLRLTSTAPRSPHGHRGLGLGGAHATDRSRSAPSAARRPPGRGAPASVAALGRGQRDDVADLGVVDGVLDAGRSGWRRSGRPRRRGRTRGAGPPPARRR